PAHPVPLSEVGAQFLQFESRDRYLDPIISDAELVVASSGEFQLKRRTSWNFGRPLARPGSKGRGLPVDYTVTLANAMAMHEAIETAVVAGFSKGVPWSPKGMAGLRGEICWPTLLIIVPAVAREGQFISAQLPPSEDAKVLVLEAL